MSKQKLFDEESDEDVALITENEYAKKYDKWREKEELHKLEQKYGSKALNSDASVSSDSEDESDEPPEISEEQETQFLKTLALLKTKDPRIYDPSFKFFDDSNKKEEIEKETKPKQLTFADSDDDDDDNDGNIFRIEKKAEIDTDTRQRKTSETKEGKLKEYLTGEAEHVDDEVEKDLAPLKALWSDPKLNEGEAFLRDYILNKKYLEDCDTGEAETKIRDDEDLEADEQRVEEQGKFERAYNFRFEEPDQEYLKRYPRTMNYIRPKDDSRSRKRVELRTRKEEEKKKKMEEIARLKALKLKEIQEKIAKIKEVTGNEDLGFKDEDLESEFDPAEHDKRMREIFDEQYYGDADTEKPVFPDLDEELEIENWENYQPEYDETQPDIEAHCEDEDFNMDADYDPKQARANLLEEVQKTLGKTRRNRKKKSKLAEILVTEKPKFIPTVAEKSYDQYMEEYYKMDCEDIIGGDLPTRFKYREVVPNDYGLSIEEILLADDRELTQWVPLKKILKHRPDHMEKGDAKTYAQKAADVKLKKKILPSLFKDLPEEPEIAVPIEEAKKKKKKKKRNKKNEEHNTEDNITENKETEHTINDNIDNIEGNTPKKGKKRKHKDTVTEENGVNEESIIEVPKTAKKKKKNRINNENIIQEDENLESTNTKQNNSITTEEVVTEVLEIPKKKRNTSISNEIIIEDAASEVVESPKKNNKKKKDGSKKDSINEESRPTVTTEVDRKEQKNKKKHKTEFIVESVDNALPSQIGTDITIKTNKVGKQNNIQKINRDKNHVNKKNTKNKFNKNKSDGNKNKKGFKKNFKNDKFKNRNKNKSDNPLGNLSDERLKAYGLNPKKYKNFLVYKKF